MISHRYLCRDPFQHKAAYRLNTLIMLIDA